jgi:hypothetical protein
MRRKLNTCHSARLWSSLASAALALSCTQFNLDVPPDAISGASSRSDAGLVTADAPIGSPGNGAGGGSGTSGGNGGSGQSGGSGAIGGPGGAGSPGGSGGAGNGPPAPQDPVCSGSQHLCHGTCVDSKSPMTCGMGCDDPCPAVKDGIATCDGTQCGAACPGGKKLCLSACVPDTQSCTGPCPAGSHNCNGICADDKSTNFCGAACKACRPPQGGTATCTNGDCVYACDKGKFCGDKCGDCCKNEDCPTQQGQVGVCDLASNQCKYSCASGARDCHGKCIPESSCCDDKECPMNAGKVGKCDSSTGKCDYMCAGDTKPCAGGCIPGGSECCEDRDCQPPSGKVGMCDQGSHRCRFLCAQGTDSPASCGDSCTRCNAPSGGQAICVNGQCDFVCPGADKCGNQCRNLQADLQNCGSCGNRCSPPAGGQPFCLNGQCDFACPGATKCKSQCRDTQNDVQNCGGCGIVCSLSNAQATCSAGQCEIGACKAGFSDCNHKASDGCEADLKNDPNNCGKCGACADHERCIKASCSQCGDPGFSCCPNFQCPGGGMCCRDSAIGQCAFNCGDCGKPGLPCCRPDSSCVGSVCCPDGRCAATCTP